MTFWLRIQSHDRGPVNEPPTLRESLSALFALLLSGCRKCHLKTVISVGSARAKISPEGSIQLLIPFTTEAASLISEIEFLIGSLLSDRFDPDMHWGRQCRQKVRSKVFNVLKAIIPPTNADYYLDYVRPVEKLMDGRVKCKVAHLGSRLLENARQAFVPNREMSEPEEENGANRISFEMIAWRGLVLRPKTKTGKWDVSIQKEADNSSFYVVDKDGLGRIAWSTSRNELKELIRENLCFLWRTYAVEDDDRLTPGAHDLKTSLRARFEEV